MSSQRNIYYVLQPLFYKTKILGLTPFDISHDGFENSNSALIYSLVLLVFLTTSSYLSVRNRPSQHYGPIMELADFFHIYLSIASTTATILFGCIFKNKIMRIIKNIKLIDKELENILDFDLKNSYGKNRKYVILATILTSSCAYGVTIIDYLSFVKEFTFLFVGNVIAYCSSFITIFVELQFCTLALLLRQRFQWLNLRMTNICQKPKRDLSQLLKVLPLNVKEKRRVPVIPRTSTEFLTEMENIQTKHSQICKICKQLNNSYSIQLLAILTESFLSVLVYVFYFSKFAMRQQFPTLSALYIIYCVAKLLLSIIQILLLVLVCSRTSREAKRTGTVIYQTISQVKVSLPRHQSNLENQATYFSLQVVQQELKFTACKLFVIDETLLYSIIAAIMSYYIIVINFELEFPQ